MSNRTLTTVLGIALGALIMLISAQLSGEDRALKLAGQFGLGSGVSLGAIVGGIASFWLALGGQRRIAGLAGWVIALGLGALLWGVGSASIWILEIILTGIFGQAAAGLAPFVGIGLLIAIVRAVAGLSAEFIQPLLARLLREPEQRTVGPPAADAGSAER